MEFSINGFADTLREVIKDNFPYGVERNPSGSLKHPNAPEHIRDVAFMRLPVVYQQDSVLFDIGSDFAEERYPYYHILEDSQVIHIRNKATKSSKGSQDKISNKRARDYGRVNWNGKTFTQEYKKNVRGKRSQLGNARRKAYYVNDEGVVFKFVVNPQANTYANIHYKYIERAIDKAVPILEATYGLKSARIKNTGLSEEYALQSNQESHLDFATNIISAISSFMEE